MRSRRMIHPSLVVLIVAALFPGEARSAEQPESAGAIVAGSKVRFRAPAVSQRRVQGRVTEMDDSSLLISTENEKPFRVSRQAITQLEVAVARRGNARKGLIIGAVAGAVFVGLVAAVPAEAACPTALLGDPQCLESRDLLLAAGLPVLALGGAGIGALIKSDRWAAVPLTKVHMTLAPTRGRSVGLTLSLRF